VGKASDWLREERRKVLGDWTAVCLRCGAARRWFEEFEAQLPSECPSCGGELLHRCPACSAPFSSTFAVECEQCGTQLREPELFGVRIRRAENPK
jgi:DNA-directed RNA polymerase subunit RPC12/RpoP